MKKRKIIFLIVIAVFFLSFGIKTTYAEESLTDIVSEELDNIDLSEVENMYEDAKIDTGKSFTEVLGDLLAGKFSADKDGFFEYLKKIFLNDMYSFLPVFASVIGIAVLCSLLQNFKSSYLSEGVNEVVFMVGFASVTLIIVPQMVRMWTETQKAISDIAKAGEIMCPIMATLMVATGSEVSASVYKPSLLFFTNGIINVYSSVILPIAGLIAAFSAIAVFSPKFKLNKFIDFFASVIKWIVGFIVTFFGVYLSAAGITSATYDGITFKAAKYVVSNSVPIVGGFLKDGFDLVLAGSVLIKNSVGVIGIILVFYKILTPLVSMVVFSFLLKLTAAVTETFSFSAVSALMTSLSKSLSYYIMALLTVGLMFFILVLLMILSAGCLV